MFINIKHEKILNILPPCSVCWIYMLQINIKVTLSAVRNCSTFCNMKTIHLYNTFSTSSLSYMNIWMSTPNLNDPMKVPNHFLFSISITPQKQNHSGYLSLPLGDLLLSILICKPDYHISLNIWYIFTNSDLSLP